MRKNGFTLIELLAVIVILAIIALIATPIILGIINDAREESNERSVELYASAVRNGIVAYQLREGKEVEAKTYKSSELTFVEFDGEVECDTVDIYEDGKIYVADCTVNGTEVDYTYGEKQELPSTQVYKPQYYGWSTGTVGGDLPKFVSQNVSDIETYGFPFYIAFDVDADNKIIAAYSCFVRNGIEYCLKGYDTEAFVTNNTVLLEAFGESACSFENDEFYCSADGLNAYAGSNGFVGAGSVDESGASSSCYVHYEGYTFCYG